MTKKKIARSRKGTKGKPVDREIRRAAGRAGIPSYQPKPDPWKLTGTAFDGGEGLSQACTAADLFTLCFEADEGADLLDQVLLCASDDMEIIGAAIASGHVISGPLARFMLRSEWRIRVAREVHRRIQAAEQTAGGAS